MINLKRLDVNGESVAAQIKRLAIDGRLLAFQARWEEAVMVFIRSLIENIQHCQASKHIKEGFYLSKR